MHAPLHKALFWYINLLIFAVLLHIFTLDTLAAALPTIHRRAPGAPIAALRPHSVGQQNKQECIPLSSLITQIGEQTIWSRQATALFTAPIHGTAIAHIGLYFPLTLLQDPCWAEGTLWSAVAWSTPTGLKSGWIPAAATTFLRPEQAAGWASLDVLDPDLLTFLAPLGSHVGVSLFDVTNQRHYTYQEQQQFLAASSIKVPIMLTFLDMLEHQGREPSDDELALLTSMIENSDNDAASTLYYDETNGADSITRFCQQQGITGLSPSPNAWGYSLITPQAMSDLLTLLQQGKILTAPDRTLALNLMEQVESDQQVGVGDTAPAGTTVAMKNGWVVDGNGLWVMNSSGIVMGQKETYILTIYTQGLASLADEQAIVQHVARTVASLLLPV